VGDDTAVLEVNGDKPLWLAFTCIKTLTCNVRRDQPIIAGLHMPFPDPE